MNAVALMLFAFIPALLGMAAYHAFPSLPTQDLALPRLLMEALPYWIGGLTLAAVFSAEISSADAVLFMLTTSLSRDLYQTYIDPDASERRMLTVSRITAVVAGLAGVVLAAILPDVITALTIFYSILSVALFVPLIAGLYSTRPNATRGPGNHRRLRPGDGPRSPDDERRRNGRRISSDLGHRIGGAHHGAAHDVQTRREIET